MDQTNSLDDINYLSYILAMYNIQTMKNILDTKILIDRLTSDYLNSSNPVRDRDFDQLYPDSIKILSDIHWTSLEIAVKAADLLVKYPETRVLDIGSGVGKFCILGALTTDGIFTGVEYRKSLVNISQGVIKQLDIHNAEIIHSDIVNIDFANYDAFYFFNSFGENIADVWPKIDSFSDLSTTNYKKYTNYVYQQFENLDSGTRIVTHCGDDNQIPDSYILRESYFDGDLQLWIKK